jgi:acetyltransferase-like isoleucine patch superfamily enzyme
MIKSVFQNLLSKTGKSYTIDKDIPVGLFYNALFNRFMMLIRGYLFLQKKAFVGKNCTFLNKSNIIFGKNVTIEKHTRLDGYAKDKIVFGNNVKIGAYSNLLSTSHFSKFGKGLKIGNHSAFGSFTEFGAGGGIEIGDNVIAGSYISFHSENHNFSDTTKLIREQGVTSKGIKVGNNVWIGAKVTILDGTIIGDNCVIAAGAVLNSTYPKDCIIGGVPGKIIKSIE